MDTATLRHGICIARFLPLPQTPILIAIAIIGLFLAYKASHKGSSTWHLFFSASIILLGATRFLTSHLAPNSEVSKIPREAEIELQIKTLFNATDPETALGIATVVSAPIQQSELKGLRLFFFLETQRLDNYPVEGETFSAIGVIRPLLPYYEGDRFDAYLRNLGIVHAYKQGYLLERTAPAIGLASLANQARTAFANSLSQNKIPESPYTGAYKGLMLGQKSELTPEQKQLFLSNGTMHIFAISGLHIGVIALCFHHLLSLMRLDGSVRAVVALLAVACFVIITGGSASSWRALLMVACLYLTTFGHKQASPLNALVASALIYLLLLPGQLFQAGFQMSYLTVSSILLLGLPLAKSLNRLLPLFPHIPHAIQTTWQRWLCVSKRWLLDATGVSIAAFLSSALLGIYYFQILPTYGILINLVALPIASLAIVAGFLSLLLSPLNTILPISELFNNAALVLIKLIHLTLEFTSTLPASSIATAPIPASLAATAILSSLALVAYGYCQLGKPREQHWQFASVLACGLWIGYLQL